jgi:hypothetical protein
MDSAASIERAFSDEVPQQIMMYSYPAQLTEELIHNTIGFAAECGVHFGTNQLWSILEAIRTLILNWSLELEKSGVVGDGLAFTMNEKREAGPVTNHIVAQNIGVFGNVTDQATVRNRQVAVLGALDLEKARQTAEQIRQVLVHFPADQRPAVEAALTAVVVELGSEEPNPSRVRGLLDSIRTTCEGAAGTVVGEGVLALLRGLLG